MQQSILGEIFNGKTANGFDNANAAHTCSCHRCSQSASSKTTGTKAISQMNGKRYPKIGQDSSSLLSEVFLESEDSKVSDPNAPVINRKSKEYIEWVQRNLNRILRLKLSTNGVLTSQTTNAIKEFQRKSKLNPSGTMDPKTESALMKGGATAPPGTRISKVPSKVSCIGEKEITAEFRKFIKDAQAQINKSTTLSSGEKASIIRMIQTIVSVEGSVDIQKFKVFSCSKINNQLALWGESVGAEINVAANTLRLSDSTLSLSDDFKANNDLGSLISFFQTIAHEKRHATLGSTVQVADSALKSGFTSSDALQAQYRAEEIIVRAEEIAVGKRMNSKYSVPIVLQQLIRKHWVVVEARVNNTERTRLRNLIINQLRKRYGFKSSCDNTITVGVLSCMDNARWHVCSSGSVVGKIPPELKLCKNKDGTHQVCGIH